MSIFHKPSIAHVTESFKIWNLPSSSETGTWNVAVYLGLTNLFNRKSSTSSKGSWKAFSVSNLLGLITILSVVAETPEKGLPLTTNVTVPAESFVEGVKSYIKNSVSILFTYNAYFEYCVVKFLNGLTSKGLTEMFRVALTE